MLKSTLSLKSYLRSLKKVKASPNFETDLMQKLQTEVQSFEPERVKRFLTLDTIPLKPALGTFIGAVALASTVFIYYNYNAHSNVRGDDVVGKPINNRVLNNQTLQPSTYPRGQLSPQGVENTGQMKSSTRPFNLTSVKDDSSKNQLNIKEVKKNR